MKENNLEKIDLSFLPPKIGQEVIKTVRQGLKELKRIKWPIRAVVWGGGFKNGEVALTEEALISDIDLYIFSNFCPLFFGKVKEIEKEINKKGSISFHYHGVIPLFLNKSRTYWAYRLKHQGIVLQNDKRILNKIRATAENIPQIEAIRILFWNLALWLNPPFNPQRILRSYLNLGESYLTFAGKLAPSFKERSKNFDEIARQFNLSDELINKIKLGYQTRMGPFNLESVKNLTLKEAKKDCLETINHLLSLYLKTDSSLEEKLDALSSQLAPKPLFNLFFCFFLRKLKEIRPKFLPIFLKFKISDLWKIAAFHRMADYQKRDSILNKYFFIKNFSDETLIEIYQSYPLPSTFQVS